MVGRLASIIAKKLLSGYKIVVVRTEELVYSGAIHRQTRKAMQFRVKRTLTNPTRGPFHQRSPSRVFRRVVRGMLPHKTARGQSALHNLKVFEGIPAPYDKKTRLVVPQALRTLRLKPGRRFCVLGEVQRRVGWQYATVVSNLEDKRKAKAYKWHLEQKAIEKKRKAAFKAVRDDKLVQPYSALLRQFGK